MALHTDTHLQPVPAETQRSEDDLSSHCDGHALNFFFSAILFHFPFTEDSLEFLIYRLQDSLEASTPV